jgi:hypothetical protein
MQLPGRLKTTTLGDLLGKVYRERATGALELAEANGQVHRVHVAFGEVTFVEIDRACPPLSDLLRREDSVPEDVLRRSLLRALASQRLHGEVLAGDFHVAADVVHAALRKQLVMRLQVLETVQDAQISFRVAVRPRGQALGQRTSETSVLGADPRGPLRAEEFLHGRRRARDVRGFSTSARNGGAASRLANGLDDKKRAALRILGLSERGEMPDVLEVKRAYRRLVREIHPDAHPQADATLRRALGLRFSEVTAAYQELVA